jgi:hypothetical protein
MDAYLGGSSTRQIDNCGDLVVTQREGRVTDWRVKRQPHLASEASDRRESRLHH